VNLASITWRADQLARRWRQDPRIAEARARVYLRHVEHLGRGAQVLGRPKVHNRRVRIGDDFLLYSVHRTTHLGGTGPIEIGDRVFLNSGAIVLAFVGVHLADDCGLASEVFVTDSDNHGIGGRPVREGPVEIGEGAWIATRATILAGVHIGRRAVVAAGAVVVDDVPDDTLVGGVPARPIRRIEYPDGRATAWK
jgi:acetyltransferase-like isoleucine patch superfamily enzyme